MAYALSTPGIIASSGSDVPVGSIISFTSTTEPAGWLPCNGQLVQIASYPRLYSTISMTFSGNSVPPAGQFRIPDLRGRFIRGTGTDGSSGMSPNAFGIKQDYIFQDHWHDVFGVNAQVNGNLTFGYSPYRDGIDSESNPWRYQICNWTLGSTWNAQWLVAGGPTNASVADEVRPHNMALLWCIKF